MIDVLRSLVLVVLAALAEIGGAWLVCTACGRTAGGSGSAPASLLSAPTVSWPPCKPDAHFGRIVAAYGGVFVAGSLAWGMVMDSFRPDRYHIAGALVCLVGVAVIMYAPRSA